jgi:hypothetical protein
MEAIKDKMTLAASGAPYFIVEKHLVSNCIRRLATGGRIASRESAGGSK